MISIHRKYRILRNGSVKFLWNDYQGLCYGRFSHTEQIIVAINNRDEGREAVLEIWGAGITRLEESILTRIMLSTQEGYTDEPEYLTARRALSVSICAAQRYDPSSQRRTVTNGSVGNFRFRLDMAGRVCYDNFTFMW